MKKRLLGIAAILMAGAAVFTGCSEAQTQANANTETETNKPTGEITVISREDGSGTRGAFIELFGIEQKDENGDKVDYTVDWADITNSTAVMMTSVAQNSSAIGYISLGSLNDTVTALSIDGAEATVAAIESGDYKISRPFNIVTSGEIDEATQDFINFIMSAEGQKVVEENGYISVGDKAAYSGTNPAGKIVVAGSSSVTPVMEKLKEAYLLVNANAEIEIQQSDSTTGVNSVIEGVCNIGMASREIKDSELEKGVTGLTIAKDGIAVIVSNDNGTTNLTSEQVMKIYTGEVTIWDELQ